MSKKQLKNKTQTNYLNDKRSKHVMTFIDVMWIGYVMCTVQLFIKVNTQTFKQIYKLKTVTFSRTTNYLEILVHG